HPKNSYKTAACGHQTHQWVTATKQNPNSLVAPASVIYCNINSAVSTSQLDRLARALWHSYGQGEVPGHEATFLAERGALNFPTISHRIDNNEKAVGSGTTHGPYRRISKASSPRNWEVTNTENETSRRLFARH